MPQTTQVRRISINVDTKGSAALKDIADKLGGVSNKVSEMEKVLGRARQAVVGFFGFLGARELINLSDEMQNLNNRLKIVTGSTEAAAAALAKIVTLANENNSSVSDTALIFNRLGTSLKQTAIGTDALIELTRTLQNSFRVSGSTAEETTGAIVQLSQSFSSGTLRGQELRSVLTQNAVLADLLKKKYGTNLFKSAEAGMIKVSEILQLIHDNAAKINDDAAKLTPTINQSLTKAFNNLQLAVFEANKQFEISQKFAQGLQFITDNITTLAGAIGILAATQIPVLVTQLSKLAQAAGAFALANPGTAALGALAIAILAISDNLDFVYPKFLKFEALINDLVADIQEFGTKFNASSTLLRIIGADAETANKPLEMTTANIKRLRDESAKLRAEADTYDLVVTKVKEVSNAEREYQAALAKQKLLEQGDGKRKIKEILAELNNEYLKGVITLDQYNNAVNDFNILKITEQFSEGKIEVDKFNEALNKFARVGITQQFNQGKITLQEFKDAIEQTNIDDLNTKLRAGAITLAEYNVQLAKVSENFSAGGAFRAGLQGYVEAIGTTTQQVAGLITQTFNSLETSFLGFIKTGKFNFAQFTQQILDDLLKIIIRASILKPLAEGLLNSGIGAGAGAYQGTAVGSPTSGGNYATPAFAKGGVFKDGIHYFAGGGAIVNRATAFGFGQGQRGVMGEAGPEAILPLSRGSGGQLGVQAQVTPVTVNIVNQTGADVQTRETQGPSGERTIEVLVVNKVKDGIANGQFDKVMAQTFGIKRRSS